MSAASLFGLVWLNALYLVLGLVFVWWIRGWTTWSEVARLTGLAYVCGVALVGTTWTLLVIVGVPFTGLTVIAVPLVGSVVAFLAARRRGRT
jgi:hypothetical protein